jgi:hypothetical protein
MRHGKSSLCSRPSNGYKGCFLEINYTSCVEKSIPGCGEEQISNRCRLKTQACKVVTCIITIFGDGIKWGRAAYRVAIESTHLVAGLNRQRVDLYLGLTD